MNNLEQLLKQYYAHDGKQSLDALIDQWLAEDLTADYDRIVEEKEASRPRSAPKHIALWLSAAAVALLIGVGIWLWPSNAPKREQPMAKAEKKEHTVTQKAVAFTPQQSEVTEKPMQLRSHTKKPLQKNALPAAKTLAANTAATARREATLSQSAATERTATPATSTTSDSLDYYLARLEKMLDDMGDSVYQERAEQIIRADTRLQRLVKKVYMNELDKQKENNQALYLKY